MKKMIPNKGSFIIFGLVITLGLSRAVAGSIDVTANGSTVYFSVNAPDSLKAFHVRVSGTDGTEFEKTIKRGRSISWSPASLVSEGRYQFHAYAVTEADGDTKQAAEYMGTLTVENGNLRLGTEGDGSG